MFYNIFRTLRSEICTINCYFCCLCTGDKLWWADQGTDQVGTCDKDGGNWQVLRNSTSPVMHMKVYNETVQQKGEWDFVCQCSNMFRFECKKGILSAIKPLMFHVKGTNLCTKNNGDCSQLCLPTSPTSRACMCTAGYSLRSGQQSCEGMTQQGLALMM